MTEILHSKPDRDRLADCYGAVRADRNLTSMSLYSGPIGPGGPVQTEYAYRSAEDHDGYVEYHNKEWKFAWVMTGDAGLGARKRRLAFLRHYNAVSELIDTLALPHHGSRHNFHKDLLLPGISRFVASAGKENRYGHPHEVVKFAVEASQDGRFVLVTEDQASELVETVSLRRGSRLRA